MEVNQGQITLYENYHGDRIIYLPMKIYRDNFKENIN
jgi:hypothetical protein